MKRLTLLFLSPLLLLTIILLARPRKERLITYTYTATTPAAGPKATSAPVTAKTMAKAPAKADELVDYALSLQGSPYVYAGTKPDGFDCSGFVTHVFDHFGMEVPHSSAMQAEVGAPVQRQEAQPGDLVIFTGTDVSLREPGHVGIVISQPGSAIEFVHASSNGGVKVSEVEGSRYDVRFLQIRRVLH